MRNSEKRLDLPMATTTAGCGCCSPQTPAVAEGAVREAVTSAGYSGHAN